MTNLDPLSDPGNEPSRALAIYLRGLLPYVAEAERAFQTTAEQIAREQPPRRMKWLDWACEIARGVAVKQRQGLAKLPFTDDLFKQLASLRPTTIPHDSLIEVWGQLPPPERDLLRRKFDLSLSITEIGTAEQRHPFAIAREMQSLHASLVARFLNPRDGSPQPPLGADDLGRLTYQLLDETLNVDGRLVLETLLLADHAAQTHYFRYVSLYCELTWHFRPLSDVPLAEPFRSKLSLRDWVVTLSFIVALAAALGYLAKFVMGRLGS